MLVINQQLDKLHVSRVDFQSRGMLEGPCLGFSVPPILTNIPEADEDDDEALPDGEALPLSVNLAARKGTNILIYKTYSTVLMA